MTTNNNNAPFRVGQKVICVENTNYRRSDQDMFHCEKDKEYTVSAIEPHIHIPGSWAVGIAENPDINDRYWHGSFAPINPYSNSATEELIKSINIGDTADQPIKEISTASS